MSPKDMMPMTQMRHKGKRTDKQVTGERVAVSEGAHCSYTSATECYWPQLIKWIPRPPNGWSPTLEHIVGPPMLIWLWLLMAVYQNASLSTCDRDGQVTSGPLQKALPTPEQRHCRDMGYELNPVASQRSEFRNEGTLTQRPGWRESRQSNWYNCWAWHTCPRYLRLRLASS